MSESRAGCFAACGTSPRRLRGGSSKTRRRELLRRRVAEANHLELHVRRSGALRRGAAAPRLGRRLCRSARLALVQQRQRLPSGRSRLTSRNPRARLALVQQRERVRGARGTRRRASPPVGRLHTRSFSRCACISFSRMHPTRRPPAAEVQPRCCRGAAEIEPPPGVVGCVRGGVASGDAVHREGGDASRAEGAGEDLPRDQLRSALYLVSRLHLVSALHLICRLHLASRLHLICRLHLIFRPPAGRLPAPRRAWRRRRGGGCLVHSWRREETLFTARATRADAAEEAVESVR